MKHIHTSSADAADRLLCRPIFGVPFFFAVLALVFFLSFRGIGEILSRFLERLFFLWGKIAETELLRQGVSSSVIRYLNNVYAAFVSAIAFLPQTVIFFLLMRILDVCGYMSRAIFVTDRFFRIFGLSGKAVLPILLGYGCAVSSVCVFDSDPKEETAVALALPFVPCSARLPVLLFLAEAFFPNEKVFFCVSVFILSFALIFFSFLMTAGRGCARCEPPARTAELCQYRLPLRRELRDEAVNVICSYFLRTGRAVLSCSIVFSALAMLTPSLRPATEITQSILYAFAANIAPIFRPLGFDSAEAAAALVFGFFAKENIIGILQLLPQNALCALFPPCAAIAFTSFSMFYAPCVSLLAAVTQKSGFSAAAKLFFRTFAIAYTVSFVLYTLSHILVAHC